MNIITKLNIRQKIMLALTVLAAAFLAWQIYNFVHGNTSPDKALPMKPGISVPAASLPSGGAIPVSQSLPGGANPSLTAHQQQYLNLVREYQITKMKRQVMEEEASLANAQKRISDAGRNGALVGMDSFADSDTYSGSGYQLTYLDRQAGQWTATIAFGNTYKEVRTGTRLADGSRVVAITAKGVVLQPAHGKKITVEFQGSVNVDNDAVSAATVKAHASASKKAAPATNTVTTVTVTQPKVAQPNNAKIAKMLGITTISKGAAPLKSTKDIPAAPVANSAASLAPAPVVTTPKVEPTTPAATATPAAPPAAPTADSSSASDSSTEASSESSADVVASTAPSAPEETTDTASPAAAPQAPATKAPIAQQTVKPVSVKELREHTAEVEKVSGQEVALGQISWQQAADLSAAISK